MRTLFHVYFTTLNSATDHGRSFCNDSFT